MFIIKKIDKKGIITVLIIIFVIIAIIIKVVFFGQSSTAYCDAIGNYYLEISNDFSVEDFFEQFSIDIDKSSEQKVNIKIPSEFNSVYEKYNQLQINQGFNLNKYKGEDVERYTYDVINDKENYDVKANIIIFNNKVIAGDLCTYSIDGTMTSLNDKTMIQE